MENKNSRFQKLLSSLKRFFTHNSFLKIVSLLIAFVLWFAIVNYTNPEVTVTIRSNVEVKNEEAFARADRIYSLNEKNVTISYKVRSGNRNLVKPSDFTAYIDLADYSITGAVPVYVDVNQDIAGIVSDVTHDPLIVHVNSEDIIRRRFVVNGTVNGTAADGYVIGELKHDPEVVYITGTSSEVSRIAEAAFTVDISGVKEDVHGSEKIRLLGTDGKNLNLNVKVEPYEYADYTVKIYKTKSLTIKATTEGLPRDGYVVDSIETSPTFVSVYGEDDILNSTPYISIPRYDINVDDASENKTFHLNIEDYLPKGIHLNHGDSELVVLVKIRTVMQLPEQTVTVQVPVPVPVPVQQTEAVTEPETETDPSAEEITEEAISGESDREPEEMTEEDLPEETEENTEESTEEYTEEYSEEETESGASDEGSENGH